ncbi:MAG: nucleotide exchange factor GrpE [Myxococcales bacterium]|nr:MAG: nucleotide exchange factor GrpE [Myxococcales bacterium]
MTSDKDARPANEAASAEATPDSSTAAHEASGPASAEAADPTAQLKAELESTRDRYLRTAADFDNFRKRSRRDLEDAEKRAREGMLRDLLPVFDNLERAAGAATTTQAPEAQAIADGVRMVLKQFTDTLDRAGIKRVVTVGQPFDPNQHEAIQQIESADQPPGTVVAEVQAGYLLGDRLVRAAMVVVAKAPAS